MSTKLKQDISIGDNRREMRVNAKLTQEQVSAELETLGIPMSREIVSQMELGHYSIRISVLIALKEIYKVSYEDFFKDLTL